MQQLKVGTLLQGGKYKIERVLGQGGFGITYLASDSSVPRKVAIKEFFFKQFCGRDESTSHVYVPLPENSQLVDKFKVKFTKEAKMLMNLNHTNIIKVYDTFDENGTSYYVMEYVEGGSLKNRLQQHGYISEAEAIGYIKKVGKALEYIHSKKIMHLDIKPDNIMLGNKGMVKVIDFGVSKIYDDMGNGLTYTTPVGISKGYSPFEQTYDGGVSSFSPQSDVYALAATLYKLLTDITPPASPEVKDHGLPLEPLRDKNVSSNVIAAIVNAMKLRNARTQSVKEFIHQLDDESTIILDNQDTIVDGGTSISKPTINFSYPLTIPINKKVYTDCQLWKVKSLKLLKTKSVLTMSVQSYDQPTTAWSGSGKIRTDEGVVYKQRGSNIPLHKDETFVIEPWEEENVEDVFPAIPQDVTGLNILCDNVILKGIEIKNSEVYVPDANKEEFIGITKAEYQAKRYNKNNTTSHTQMQQSSEEGSEFSVKGMIYILFIIGLIVFIIKALIS